MKINFSLAFIFFIIADSDETLPLLGDAEKTHVVVTLKYKSGFNIPREIRCEENQLL